MTASQILTRARDKLIEPTANFWSDAELLDHLNHGVRDLYRAIVNTLQDHFFKTNANVLMLPGQNVLANVPNDVARVLGILPVAPNNFPTLNFFYRRYTHPDMLAARATDAQDPSVAGPIYYSVTGAGAPQGSPIIYVAPKITAQVALELTYTPSLVDLTLLSSAAALDTPNPIPGESDDALIAYVIAHALSKDRDDSQPDPSWLQKYATEKQNILAFLDPRQEDEPPVAEGVHEAFIM